MMTNIVLCKEAIAIGLSFLNELKSTEFDLIVIKIRLGL